MHRLEHYLLAFSKDILRSTGNKRLADIAEVLASMSHNYDPPAYDDRVEGTPQSPPDRVD